MDFQKKNWQFRDIISENELNRMEDGIEEGITKAEQAQQTAESHASRHASEGPDPITPEMIGAETPSGAQSKVNAHASRTDNPHNVTKAQVGLGNVDNMSATSIRTDSGRALRVEVVSSSGSQSPTAGRIIFDSSQGKFFGGNGSEWV